MATRNSVYVPISGKEKAAILEQVERIVAHPTFRNSENSIKFLRYVVERTLEGTSDNTIKERTIGVEVFGRDPNYDTTQDRVARATAAEVRFRIAKYYYDIGSESEIRIDFRPGSYIPEFRLPGLEAPSDTAKEQVPARPFRAVISVFRQTKFRQITLVVTVLCIAALVFLGIRLHRKNQPAGDPAISSNNPQSFFNRFWEPLFKSSEAVQICVDDLSPAPHAQDQQDVTGMIPLENAFSLVRFGDFLYSRNKNYELRAANSLMIQDVRSVPLIMILKYTNPWTNDSIDSFRFRIVKQKDSDLAWIQDRKNPTNRMWTTSLSQASSASKFDYALVVRMGSKGTSQVQIIIDGTTENSIAGAMECLISPGCLNDPINKTVSDSDANDLEVVIETSVINGHPGRTRIVSFDSRGPK